MPASRTIPSESPKSVSTYDILSDGVAISETYQLLSINIAKEVNKLPSAVLVFADGSPSGQTFAISNSEDLIPGKKIEINLGYTTTNKTAFKGVIVKNGIQVRKKGSLLIVECRDESYKMTLNPTSKYFHEKKDSDAIEEIISTYGLPNDVAGTQSTHLELIQYNCTDWDFILTRADMNGLICLTSDGEIKIAAPDLSASPKLEIQYGATIYELDAEIDARLQMGETKGKSWQPPNQELIDNLSSEEPQLEEPGNISSSDLAEKVGPKEFSLIHTGPLAEQDVQEWLNAKLLKHRLAKIRGSVTIDGTVDVLPGDFVKLHGLGERFSGKIFASGVQQTFKEGRWLSTIQLGLNPEWFVETYKAEQPLAAAHLPAIQGLQIGIVTSLVDPEGENRIKVKIPVLMNDDEGAWCRVSTLDAGSDRGSFFLPEIDDEVLVGFLNNDPRYGIVLGMLHSSAHPPTINASDDNHEKGFTTRSGMNVLFNDDKESIQIDTPKGNQIFIHEGIRIEDEHGNKIEMNSDGITIESISDLNIKASGNVNMEGGTNVEVSAGAGATVKGQASAELSSGGSLTIQGSIVNIN